MIFRTPQYYQEFRCIADQCKDNCCIGWEIEIDAEAAEHYRKIPGEFGERLRSCIRFGQPSVFVLDAQERCPFLNDRNLCDIITTLGEPVLCQICTDHPRYYEWFGTVKEGGIGMCCEAAAMLILSQDGEFSVTETEIPDEGAFPHDEALFAHLLTLRTRLFALLHEEAQPLHIRLSAMLRLAYAAQLSIDNGGGIPEEIPEIAPEKGDPAQILQFLRTLEPISPAWHPALKAAEQRLPELARRGAQFWQKNPQAPKYLRNIAVYFLWRYLLKGTFDGEFLSRAVLAVASVCVIASLWAADWQDAALSIEECAELAKNYSKEIEYSEDNLNALLDAAYDLPALSVPQLLGILADWC